MQYGGVMMKVLPNSERVECVKFNSFRVGKHCLLQVPRLASRVIRIQSFQDLARYSHNKQMTTDLMTNDNN